MRAEFDAADIRGPIENSLAAAAIADATPTWTLANHDVDREPTRYGGGEVGLARARAMALVMLALPGAVFIYNGEELGLPNVELPDEALQDPVWERSGQPGAAATAAGCRCHGRATRRRSGSRPIPTPGCRYRRSGRADGEAQLDEPDSTLTFFRRAIELRQGTKRNSAAPPSNGSTRRRARCDVPAQQRIGVRAQRGPPRDAAARRARCC